MFYRSPRCPLRTQIEADAEADFNVFLGLVFKADVKASQVAFESSEQKAQKSSR